MGAHPVTDSPVVRRIAAVTVSLLTVTGLVISAQVAAAQPQPSIGQVQAKLKKLTLKENWLIQRYDQVSQDFASARQRLVLVNREVKKDRAAMQRERDQIAQIAATVYENGSMTSTAVLLTSNNPQTLLSQSAILVHLSTDNRTQFERFIATDKQLIGAQQMAKRTETAVAAIRNKLAKQKATLHKVITEQQSVLSTLTAKQRQQQLGGSPPAGGSGGGGGHYHGPTGTQAEKAVAFAYAQLGCPYVFGGTGPCHQGFDCSGLTSQAWAAAGVAIPRTSYGQATLPRVVRADLQPGDIIEFAGESHVGIYVGGGDVIDAPQPGQNVEKVSLSSGWYNSEYDFAVRP